MTDDLTGWLFGSLFALLFAAPIWLGINATKRGRKEAIYKFIAKHEQALAKKRRQLVQQDAYGNENTQRWNKEKKYFINTALIPHLRGIEPHYYDMAKLKELYPSLDATVEDAALHGLASLPASNTITDITTGHEYEHFCANLLSESGWDSRVTKASGDQGADIIAHYNGLTVVFQCKFYTHPVGNKAVQEAVAARIHEQADLAVVVSNSTFTKSAEELAGTTETILINHDDIPALKKIIRRKVGSDAARRIAPNVAGSLSDKELGEQLAATYHAQRRGKRTDDR